jgi:hypothetical protein
LSRRFYSLAAYWHLLSLDAPSIAGTWSWFFARAMHLHLSLMQWMLLPAGTWLIYVSDRILDGLGQNGRDQLRPRHHFYARHRLLFGFVSAIMAVALSWAVLTYMNPIAFRDDLWIGGLAAAYLLAVHRSRIEFPKELATAILFASATAVPAWSRLSSAPGRGKHALILAVLLFALLCWINCAGIEKWEGGRPHRSTRWVSVHLRSIASAIAMLALVAAVLAPTRGLAALYLAALGSSGALFLLDARSSRLPAMHVRIAADAALLTPLALVAWAR